MFNQRILRTLAALAALLAPLAARADIRFYTVNDLGQQSLLPFAWNTDEPGCHALPLSWKVHRVAVVRFAHCVVYSSRDCAAGSEVPAYWKRKPNRVATSLTPGTQWYLDPEGEVSLGSWKCE